MNLLLLQIIVTLFSVFMIYMAFITYKKRQILQMDFILWAFVWVCFIIGINFPESFKKLIETLRIGRTMDLLFISAFIVLFFLLFFLFKIARDNQKKINLVVEHLALKKQKRQ